MNSENHDWKSFLLDLVSDLTPGAFVSILFLIFVILIGLFAPWLAPFDQGEILTNESFEPPSSICIGTLRINTSGSETWSIPILLTVPSSSLY